LATGTTARCAATDSRRTARPATTGPGRHHPTLRKEEEEEREMKRREALPPVGSGRKETKREARAAGETARGKETERSEAAICM
jgi:hypothetical protein